MVFITTWARGATSFCLLMALILTAFLLSGSTNETSGVRALYNIELKWTEPTTTSSTATTAPVSAGTETRTTITPQKTSTRLSNRVATSTVNKEPLTTETAAVLTKKSLVEGTWASPASWEGGSPTLVVRDPAGVTGSAGLGKVDRSVYEPERNFERSERANIRPPAGKGKRPHIGTPRAEHTNKPIIHQVLRPRASPLSPNATVLISYFGLCTYTPETQWHCTSHRSTANSSSVLPPRLHVLSKALQKALSPIPPILATISLGLLLITTITLEFVKSLGATHKKILGKVYLGVGLLAVIAGTFSAVLFRQSGVVVFAVLDSMQVGGGEGVNARKGGSGIAVAWAAVFFEAVGFLGSIWLVLFASEDASMDRDDDGGSAGSSIFSRVFGKKKKDEQGQELQESVAGGRNSPAIPENIHPALRSGNITISAPMEVHRDVHPLRGNFQRENHPPSREFGGERERERVLSAGSVSGVSVLSDSSSVRGAGGGRREGTISTVSDVTTVREAGSGGRGKLEAERLQNLRRGNSPFPGGWNMI